MKRYEIEGTTSVNNIKTVYNELVKSMDGLGYTNLLRNNYFKTKLRNDDTTSGDIVSQWRDNENNISEAEYNGTHVDGTNFLYLSGDNNDDVLGIATDNEIYQEVQFNDVERLMQTGVLNLKLFFIKNASDSDDLTITLESTDDDTDWSSTTTLGSYVIDSESVIVAGEFTDAEAFYYAGGDQTFVYTQYNISYNLIDDLFRYVDTTNNLKFRVLISNPSGASTKYLVNTLAYFGRSDASSFVKNIDDNSGSIQYDETIGDYYYTADGEDKIYLSSGKYFITVGDTGQYTTLESAVASLSADSEAHGNSRVMYITSDLALEADVEIPSNITIMGNGYELDVDEFKIDISGSDAGDNAKKNINVNDLNIVTGESGAITTTAITMVYCNRVNFNNCTIDGKYKYNGNLIDVNYCDNCTLDLKELKNYGYNDGDDVIGYGIYMDNTNNTEVTINKMILETSTGTKSATLLIGVFLNTTCGLNGENTTTVNYFSETV